MGYLIHPAIADRYRHHSNRIRACCQIAWASFPPVRLFARTPSAFKGNQKLLSLAQ